MFNGKTIVIKYGGAAMQSEALNAGMAEDVAGLAASGANVVIVHGGGPEISSLQKSLGAEPVFVDGSRITDEVTMDAALMALCGKVNKELVRLLENSECRAAGISGIDGGILRCVRQSEPDIGFVGEIKKVDTGLLIVLMDSGYVPVVSTVGIGEDGLAYNINADIAAGRIAASLAADHLITISDVPGVMRDAGDPSSIIHEIREEEAEGLIESGIISGGMIPKARGLADAIRRGVGSALIIDGRTPHTLQKWMDGTGAGTRFINGQREH